MKASLDQLTVQFVFHTAGHARGGNLRIYIRLVHTAPVWNTFGERRAGLTTWNKHEEKNDIAQLMCQPYWTVSNQRRGRRQDGWMFLFTVFVADCHDGDDRRFPYDGIRWFGLWLCQSKCGWWKLTSSGKRAFLPQSSADERNEYLREADWQQRPVRFMYS